MKVLFYFGWSFAETGGTQRAVLAIGSGLIAKGHSVTILNDSLEIATPFYPYDPALEIRYMCEDVRAIEPTDVRKEPARSPTIGKKKSPVRDTCKLFFLLTESIGGNAGLNIDFRR